MMSKPEPDKLIKNPRELIDHIQDYLERFLEKKRFRWEIPKLEKSRHSDKPKELEFMKNPRVHPIVKWHYLCSLLQENRMNAQFEGSGRPPLYPSFLHWS